eukprot:362713-Chlamydomonas_euryale.AAC.3
MTLKSDAEGLLSLPASPRCPEALAFTVRCQSPAGRGGGGVGGGGGGQRNQGGFCRARPGSSCNHNYAAMLAEALPSQSASACAIYADTIAQSLTFLPASCDGAHRMTGQVGASFAEAALRAGPQVCHLRAPATRACSRKYNVLLRRHGRSRQRGVVVCVVRLRDMPNNAYDLHPHFAAAHADNARACTAPHAHATTGPHSQTMPAHW